MALWPHKPPHARKQNHLRWYKYIHICIAWCLRSSLRMQTSALRHRHRQRQPTLSNRAQFKVYSIEQRTRGGLASRPRRRAAGSDRLLVGVRGGCAPAHARIPTAVPRRRLAHTAVTGVAGHPPLPTSAKRGGGGRSAQSPATPVTSTTGRLMMGCRGISISATRSVARDCPAVARRRRHFRRRPPPPPAVSLLRPRPSLPPAAANDPTGPVAVRRRGRGASAILCTGFGPAPSREPPPRSGRERPPPSLPPVRGALVCPSLHPLPPPYPLMPWPRHQVQVR